VPDSLLDRIRERPDLVHLLAASTADFDVTRTYEFVEDVHLASGARLERIAGDAAGGAFFQVGEGGDERPVLYADSEGSAGLLARDLRSAVEVVVLLPYWHDLLGLSGVEGLDAMRAEARRLEAEFAGYAEEDPDLEPTRQAVIEALGLPWGPDPLAALYAALSATEPDYLLVNSAENVPYQSLRPGAA
jgi:hypothetical protein